MQDDVLDLDPELLDFFLEESSEVVELSLKSMEEFTKTQAPVHFEGFGQYIDRVMGAAYTLGLQRIGDLAKLGKELGYKTSQTTDIHTQLSIQGLLFQLIRETERELTALRRGVPNDHEDFDHLMNKLRQASSALGNLRSSVIK
jgi:hypothetical protein